MKKKQIFAILVLLISIIATSCGTSEDLDELVIEQVKTNSESSTGGNAGGSGGVEPPPPSVD